MGDHTRSEGLVIVVDDDPSVSTALSRLFRAEGFEVETHPSSDSFLRRAETSSASCLVLDLRMPGAGGLDLQATLVENFVDLPIVFISGDADVPASVKALKTGAVDFIEKPFEDDVILDAVRKGITMDREVRGRNVVRAQVRGRYDTLTARERDVMLLVVRGLSNKQVADDLDVSEKTIKIHRGRVMSKMEAESLPELVRLADLISLDRFGA